MKVILLQDVAKIGKKTQIVDVPDGYALNKLIPQKMAEPATDANKRKIDKINVVKQASSEAEESRFNDAVESLRKDMLKIAVDVNDKGHAFKAVHESDVVELAKQKGVDIDEKMLNIPSQIKALGEYEIELVSTNAKAKFTIEVVAK